MPIIIRDGDHPDDLYQDCNWPGVIAVESCVYTCSHGIAPGIAMLRSIPQANGADAPQEFGNLTFTDGQNKPVILRDCKLLKVTASTGPDGTTWLLEIMDRRWRWRSNEAAYGKVSGRYNRADPHGKYVPWTLRSPVELAIMCLDAMGEKGYVIDLPVGLTQADGAKINRLLTIGEQFPMSNANPYIVWDYTPPAIALNQLCDQFGRRIVYQPTFDRIIIAQMGNGAAPPDNIPYETIAPSLTSTAVPRRVCVAGAPIRFQARFLLEPVGEDWQGEYVPIDALSYSPQPPKQKQVTTITAGAAPLPGLIVLISWTKPDGSIRQLIGNSGGRQTTVAAYWAALLADLDTDPAVSYSSSGSVFTITGNTADFTFSVVTDKYATLLGDNPNPWTVATTGAGVSFLGVPIRIPSWKYDAPPCFTNVHSTERLSYIEARALARKTVWQTYRVVNQNAFDRSSPLIIPKYGPLKRRQQIVLQNAKVEQIIPSPRIAGAANVGNPSPFDDGGNNIGALPMYYNGYSTDQQATVTGSIFRLLPTGDAFWIIPPGQTIETATNTIANQRVFTPFTITTAPNGEQLVTFADCVYYRDVEGRIEKPTLVLEASCMILDPDTDQYVRSEFTMDMGGSAPDEWQVRDDIMVGFIGIYGNEVASDVSTSLGGGTTVTFPGGNGALNKLLNVVTYNEADAKARALYYLQGMAKKYQLQGGGIKDLVGCHSVNPDGLVQQVTWTFGPEGAVTTYSVNTEHSAVVPPYPRRQLPENLPPNKAAAAANLSERTVDRLLSPRPGGATS